MYIKHTFVILLVLFSMQLFGQKFTEEELELYAKPANLYGTLVVPDSALPVVALIIPGSGPTDRNGNTVGAANNNSLKYLAEDLSKNGIASLRIDKRGAGKSMSAMVAESELSFDVYIEDVINWGYKVLNDVRFKKLVVIGHSEGSLVGMMATQELEKDLDVLGYISLAGAGYPIDEVIMKQLKVMPDSVQDEAKHLFEKMKAKEKANVNDPQLMALFRPSLQKYMMSWVALNPQEQIKQVNSPILLVNGTTDIQVAPDNAEVMHIANPSSQLVIIENMNHVFKSASMDRAENLKTYNNPELKNVAELADILSKFIISNL